MEQVDALELGEFFIASDFFVPTDRAHHFAGNLSLSRDTTTECMPVAARQRIKDKLTENK